MKKSEKILHQTTDDNKQVPEKISRNGELHKAAGLANINVSKNQRMLIKKRLYHKICGRYKKMNEKIEFIGKFYTL